MQRGVSTAVVSSQRETELKDTLQLSCPSVSSKLLQPTEDAAEQAWLSTGMGLTRRCLLRGRVPQHGNLSGGCCLVNPRGREHE